MVGLSESPEARFGGDFLENLYERFPAHLHVNVDKTARGAGVGAKLVERYLADLRSLDVKGIHLFCGPKPVAFYRRCGLEILGEREFKPGGVPVVAMGREL